MKHLDLCYNLLGTAGSQELMALTGGRRKGSMLGNQARLDGGSRRGGAETAFRVEDRAAERILVAKQRFSRHKAGEKGSTNRSAQAAQAPCGSSGSRSGCSQLQLGSGHQEPR